MITSCKCKECGADIPPDSPGGFCARCLLGLALDKPDPDEREEIRDAESAGPGQSPGHAMVPHDGVRSNSDAGSRPASGEKPGNRIGPFRLLEEIGQGGCGVVYMAEQERPVRRRVAIKIIKPGMDTRKVVARFEAERQALAIMDHPHIAKVLDAGATDRGRPYFAMELVGGIKITDYCNRNNLTLRQRLELFSQVCRAIQHAHQKGIIHRDIKPSNVLIAVQDGTPVPKVIDFGIAKATQGRLTDQTLFTAFEQFLGTPAYMSPEQTQPGSQDVDTRSDIYSLGVLMYELLTGKTPFDTREMLSGGLDEMCRTIREKEPPKPSTRLTHELATAKTNSSTPSVAGDPADSEPSRTDPDHLLKKKEFARDVRGDVDWIVMKCLEKNRARRYQTVNGLAMDIERHLNQEPVVARPPSWSYTLNKFFHRNKLFVSAAALVVLALLLGTVVSTWQAVRATRAERAQNRLRAEAQAAKQDAIEKLWSSRLAEARASRTSGQSGQRFESLRAIREAAAIRPSVELRNEAIASMVLADICWVGEKASSQGRWQVCANDNLDHYAVMDSAGVVEIRRLSDDSKLASLPAIGKTPYSFGAFSLDGKLLVVRDADNQLRVWDWATPAVVLQCNTDILTCAFSEDGKNLATSDGVSIIFHNLAGGKSLSPIVLGNPKVRPDAGLIRFDPSGQRLAVSFVTETNINILDIVTGRRVMTLTNAESIQSIVWHPDGRFLAAACDGTVINIWSMATGERLRSIPSEQTISLGVNHKGDLLVSSGWDGKTRLLEFATGRQLTSIYKSGFIVGFDRSDSMLASKNWDSTTLNLFEVASGNGLLTIHENLQGTRPTGGGAFFSADGRFLAYPVPEGVSVWDMRRGLIAETLPGEDLFPIGFDAAGKDLFIEGTDGVRRWTIAKNLPGETHDSKTSILSQAVPDGAAISPDGKICVVTTENGWRVVRTDTFTELTRIVTPRDAFGISLSPDGGLLAIGARFHAGVNVWDTHTGALVRQLPVDTGHGESSATVAFSHDGHRLVTSTSSEYCFWNVDSWSVIRRIPQEPGNDFPALMAFSPEGRIFAGTHSRNIVRLYDAAGAQVLADLEAPDAKFITWLAFNNDGTKLAMCESRDTLRIWDLRAIREQLAAMNLDWDMPSYARKTSVLTPDAAKINTSAQVSSP